MYKITKRMEIAASHSLCLNYDSPCQELHGHNWIIDVEISGNKLNENGMLIDFTEIKKQIHDKLDHKNLNEVLGFNPTAENIARWVAETLNAILDIDIYCSKVSVQETEGNTACYIL